MSRSTSLARWLALVLACAAAARAWCFVSQLNSSGQPRRWMLNSPVPGMSTNSANPVTRAIRYFISSDAFSAAGVASELDAVRASFDQWQSIPGTSLKFEEGGLLGPGIDVNVFDRTNAVFWARRSTVVNGGMDDISGALAVTFPRVTADNMVLEADIILNGVELAWHTDFENTNSSAYFIEATVLHEIGHFLGLDHSPVGGATMFARTGPGVGQQAGLSSDEIAAARTLYPAGQTMAGAGVLRGRVIAGGAPAFGAMVVAEDSAGNVASGTVTRRDGTYDLPALLPDDYRIRVTPLDPLTRESLARLITGADISAAHREAHTDILPSASEPLTVREGATVQFDVDLVMSSPPFRITRIRPPTRDDTEFIAINAPAEIRAGQTNVIIGVFSPDFRPGAKLEIIGAGIAFGPSTFRGNVFPGASPNLHALSISMDVKASATPGLRSLMVQDGTNVAFAHGFLEVLPPVPDHNFDGMDDRFQRRFFSRFTAPEAAPASDPDQDGSVNRAELAAGTLPNDTRSVLKIEQVTLTPNGSEVVWQSVPGKRYQLLGREQFGADRWREVGSVITATKTATMVLDSSANREFRFYRVQLVEAK